MPDLKLILSVGGRENPSVDKATAMDRGILVCYTSGALGERGDDAGQVAYSPWLIHLLRECSRAHLR